MRHVSRDSIAVKRAWGLCVKIPINVFSAFSITHTRAHASRALASNHYGDLPSISHWCKLPTAVFHRDVIDSVDGAAIDLLPGGGLDVQSWKLDGLSDEKWLSLASQCPLDGLHANTMQSITPSSASWKPHWRLEDRLHWTLRNLLNPIYTIQPVVNPVAQPGLTTVLNEQWLFVQTSCTTGLTTGWMFVYTIQPVISCKRGISSLHHCEQMLYPTLSRAVPCYFSSLCSCTMHSSFTFPMTQISGTCWFILTTSRSNSKVKVIGQSSRSHDENMLRHYVLLVACLVLCAKVVGATSSEGFSSVGNVFDFNWKTTGQH